MAKKRKHKKTMKQSSENVFPNYTFVNGSLAGQNVKSILATGVESIATLTNFILCECPKEGQTFACTGSIIYELGHAIDSLIEECEGEYLFFLIDLNDLFSGISWYPPLVYLAACHLGFRNTWDLFTCEDDEDLCAAMACIRGYVKEIYMADPIDVDLEFRCSYCREHNGCLD